MKLNIDFTMEEMQLLCNTLFEQALVSYDGASALVKEEDASDNINTIAKIQQLFKNSKALTDLGSKILCDIGQHTETE